MQKYTGLVTLDPKTYYVSTVPVELNVLLILALNLATLLICVFVLIAPSYLISHIHPAKNDALRITENLLCCIKEIAQINRKSAIAAQYIFEMMQKNEYLCTVLKTFIMQQIPSFNELIEKSVIEHWDLDALTDYKGKTLQYHDVARKIEKIHIMFEASGVQKGDRIALCGRNSSMWAAAFLATLT